jgi:hypothetical protein
MLATLTGAQVAAASLGDSDDSDEGLGKGVPAQQSR